MLVDNVADYQAQFSKWWVQEWKAVPFPERVSKACALVAPNLLCVSASELWPPGVLLASL